MKKEDIHPRNKQILFEVIKVERVTAAGVIMPGNEDQEAPLLGKVLDFGPECVGYEKGKKILLPRGVSTRIPLNEVGNEVVLLAEDRFVLANID